MQKIKKYMALALATLPLLGQAQEKKNVLFIAVDDLKPILGCYGDDLVKTPNIDRLAKRGVVFANNHCQQAVCAPSRASLLCGVQPDKTKVWDLKTLIRDMNPNILTLPQHFRQNGYFTTSVGKIYDKRSVDEHHDKVSWSEAQAFEGDYKYYDDKCGEPALGYYQLPETKEKVAKYRKEAEAMGKKGYGITKYAISFVKPTTECADVPDNAYVDGVLALSAIDRLEKLSKKEEPFFLGVGFKRPHLPFVAPKKYWDLYQREEMPLAKYQKAAENGPLLAYHNSGELRSYTDIPPLKSFSDIESDLIPVEKQKEMIHGYYAAVSYIDAQVGKVLNALDSLGLTENTVVVLWGDHGWHLGDHGIWCKHTNFEQATRSPMIIADGENHTGVCKTPTEFLDLFPTLCDLANIETPDHLDGKSLLPVLKDPKKELKPYAVSQFQRGKAEGYAFRSERYRYVVWVKNMFRNPSQFSKDLISVEELYDYKKDPLETRNVVNEKKYRKVKQQMEKYCLDYFKNR
ncbi:sulfatase [Marinifilum flexuosum]|uniref:sulfatase n=1 Tax=Marinifilum flexuosum TaxID=1117708 RepID=UPI002491252D|nr:sulfatase [Marinifilum flexuosum]